MSRHRATLLAIDSWQDAAGQIAVLGIGLVLFDGALSTIAAGIYILIDIDPASIK